MDRRPNAGRTRLPLWLGRTFQSSNLVADAFRTGVFSSGRPVSPWVVGGVALVRRECGETNGERALDRGNNLSGHVVAMGLRKVGVISESSPQWFVSLSDKVELRIGSLQPPSAILRSL